MMEYSATLTMALQTLGPVLLVGNAFFLAARFGNQAIPEVLPNDAVLLEVDQDRRPAAFFIGDELDSGHASILRAKNVTRSPYRDPVFRSRSLHLAVKVRSPQRSPAQAELGRATLGSRGAN